MQPSVIDRLLLEYEQRVSELSCIKLMRFKYKFSKTDFSIYCNSSIVMTYAIWEGFIRNVIDIIFAEINDLHLQCGNVHDNLRLYYFDHNIVFKEIRATDASKLKLLNDVTSYISADIVLRRDDATYRSLLESNVNFKVLQKIFNIFCMDVELDLSCYKGKLDRLLSFRNKVAHGDGAVKVSFEELLGNINFVLEIMADLILFLDSELNKKNYLAK